MPRRKRVAFQGERGAFSEEAARRLLGDGLDLEPRQRFQEVFRALAGGDVDYAVIPIENTLHGSVHENYDHLLHFKLPIIGETQVRIVHNLIVRPGVRFRDVRRVYSHPVALTQCLRFFEKNPQLRSESYYDTAGSVKMLMEQAPEGGAAIASVAAAEYYKAHILKRSIEDDRSNFTRFFLLARQARRGRSGGSLKTSIVFTTRNIPGALFRCLATFALRDINLIKIESRPLRGKPWEYLFYLDFLGAPHEERCRHALAHLAELADLLQVLGCYRQV
ncbi:MAG: prephenate dehydratase [Acidobacteria bacterium]|nr:prephenate dehydratase [Acidobacteriota bacterium]